MNTESWRLYSNSTGRFIETTTVFGGSCPGPFTTLRDGIPRALCTPTSSPTITITTLDDPFHWFVPENAAPVTFPLPPPPCSIDCAAIFEDYYKVRTSRFLEIKELYGASPGDLAPTGYGVVSNCMGQWPPDCYRECSFNKKVSLMYWPTDGRNESLGDLDGSTVTTAQISKTPRTIKWNNHTLTSPTVYVFYGTMANLRNCGSQHTDILIPLNSKDVYVAPIDHMLKLGMVDWGFRTIPMDFKDLAFQTVGTMSYPLVPHSMYTNQLKCAVLGVDCKTIFHDYRPVIVFQIDPAILRSIDPAWAKCGYEFQTAYDPPTALSPVSADDGPAITPKPLPSVSRARPGAVPWPIPQETPNPARSGSTGFQAGPTPAARAGDPEPLLGISRANPGESSMPIPQAAMKSQGSRFSSIKGLISTAGMLCLTHLMAYGSGIILLR
jgi:hypothetical protein